MVGGNTIKEWRKQPQDEMADIQKNNGASRLRQIKNFNLLSLPHR
jgi:hypothetical protein